MMTATLKDVLGRFNSIDGLTMAAIVSNDGVPIESITRSEDIDVEAIASVASTALQMTRAFGGAIGKGEADQTILEFQNGLVMLMPLSDQAFLLGLSESRADLGRMRYIGSKHREELEQALDEL